MPLRSVLLASVTSSCEVQRFNCHFPDDKFFLVIYTAISYRENIRARVDNGIFQLSGVFFFFLILLHICMRGFINIETMSDIWNLVLAERQVHRYETRIIRCSLASARVQPEKCSR